MIKLSPGCLESLWGKRSMALCFCFEVSRRLGPLASRLLRLPWPCVSSVPAQVALQQKGWGFESGSTGCNKAAWLWQQAVEVGRRFLSCDYVLGARGQVARSRKVVAVMVMVGVIPQCLPIWRGGVIDLGSLRLNLASRAGAKGGRHQIAHDIVLHFLQRKMLKRTCIPNAGRLLIFRRALRGIFPGPTWVGCVSSQTRAVFCMTILESANIQNTATTVLA